MPSPVRPYLISALIGFALAGLMVGLGLWFNVARLADHLALSEKATLTVVLLWTVTGLVFSAVQFVLSTVDRTDDEDDDGPGGGLRHRALLPIPVRRDENRRL